MTEKGGLCEEGSGRIGRERRTRDKGEWKKQEM